MPWKKCPGLDRVLETKKLNKAVLISIEHLEYVEDFWHINYSLKDGAVFSIFSTYVDCHEKEFHLAAVDTPVGISCAELLQDLGSSFPCRVMKSFLSASLMFPI